jgi:hypothetical protein
MMEGRLSLRGTVAKKANAKESVGRAGGIYGTEDGVFRALSPAELPRTCRYMPVHAGTSTPCSPSVATWNDIDYSACRHYMCVICHYTLGPG